MAWLFSVLAPSFEWVLLHGDNIAVSSTSIMPYLLTIQMEDHTFSPIIPTKNIRIEFHWLWLVCLGSHVLRLGAGLMPLTQATGTENEENQTSVRKRGYEYGYLLYYFQQYVVSRKVLFVFWLISPWQVCILAFSGPVDIFPSILHI